jgi:hypothetical protein
MASTCGFSLVGDACASTKRWDLFPLLSELTGSLVSFLRKDRRAREAVSAPPSETTT